MPGGETSSSKRPHHNLKDGSQKSADVMALSGAETFGDGSNLQLFDHPGGYKTDTEFGLSNYNPAPDTPGDSQGNAGFETVNVGEAPKPMRSAPKKSDATPGGGW